MGDASASTAVDPGEENVEVNQQTCFFARWLGPHSKILQIWQIFVVLTIMTTVFMDTFMWSFDSRIGELWFIVYAMDVVYIINIAVKFFSAYNDKGIIITDSTKIRRHYMKTTFLVDMLTVIPMELSVLSPSLQSMKYLAILRCNRLIRIYGVFMYFDTLESRLGTNVKRLLVCKYLTIASLVVHLMACIWYTLGCPGKHYGLDLTCRPESWAVTFNFGHDTEIETATTLRSYVLSLYWAVTTATSTGYGEVRPVTIGEKWFSICSMLMGIVVFFGVILGGMASQLTNLDTERAQYNHRLDVIKNRLRKSRIDREMGGKVIKYYKYLWYRNKGVSDQGLLNKLPITFHAEVSHSANKFVLDNARIFKGLNPGFLRMLSMIIKPSLYLPGQLIVDHNDIMTMMYFIQRGELQVMDSKQQITPVETLRCGQLFGEVNVVKTLVRYNDIRTSAHCDLLQLDRHDLNSVLAYYPGIHQCLQERVDARLSKARSFEETLKMDTRGSITVIEIEGAEAPTQCSEVTLDEDNAPDSFFQATSATAEQEQAGWQDRFIQWVMTSITELKQFDWYFMPKGKLMRFWDFLVLFIAMAVGLLYPYLTSFMANQHEEDPAVKSKVFAVMFTMDAILGIDVVMRLRTAHVTPNGTHRNFKSIWENYVKSLDFILDVLAALPLDLISLMHPTGPVRTGWVYILSLNRVLKVWRVSNFFAKKEENLDISIGLVRFGKFVLFIVLFLHWNACGWYYGLHAQGREGFDETAHDDHNEEASNMIEYLLAVYWTATTMTSTGYGDITPHSVQTYIFAIWVEIGGLLLFGYILSNVAAILTNADMHRVRFLEELHATTTFMNDHHLSTAIKRRVVSNKHTNFKCNEGIHTPGGERMMHDMPINLQEDVADFETKKLFQEVPLFKDCDEAFLRRLGLKTHRYVYAPGENIITQGDKGREMYLVINGYCEILARDDVDKVITRIGPGGFFGEISFMFGGDRMTTVQASSSVDVLLLHRKDLDEVLNEFPLIQQQIKELEEDENFMKELTHAISEDELAIHAGKHTTVKDLMEDDTVEDHEATHHENPKRTVERFDGMTEHEKKVFHEPYKELGLFALFMTKFLLRTTINPEGLIAQVWESCRVLFCLAMVAIYLFQAAFLHMSLNLWIIGYILDFICILEIYIRFHWAYYNEVGLLITHPVATSKKYLKNTFILDLIACFPIEMLAYGAVKLWTPEAIHIYAILRFNRLLQLYRVPLAFNFLEGNLQINTGTVKEVKFFFYLLLFFHTLTCMWFIQACPPVGIAGVDTSSLTLAQQGLIKVGDHYCSNHTWPTNFESLADMAPMQMYVVSLYWASATGASVGYGDITPSTERVAEMVIAVIAMTIGILYFGYIIASVAASMANADSQRASYQELLRSATSYMTEKFVNSNLKNRILKYYRYMWIRTKGIDPESLFDGLTLSLQADVSMALYKDIIEKVPLFAGTGDSFIKTLASCIKPVYYIANEYVVRKFDHGENMFFLHRGAVDVVSEDGKMVFDTMKPGRFFGEISLIMSCPRTASIRAQTNCDMFILKKNDLDEVLLGYPSIKKQILEVAEERIAAVRKRSAAKVDAKKSEPKAASASKTSKTASVASTPSTQPATVVPAQPPPSDDSATTPAETQQDPAEPETLCATHDDSSPGKGPAKEVLKVLDQVNLDGSSDSVKIAVEPAPNASTASAAEGPDANDNNNGADVPDVNDNNNRPKDDAMVEMEIDENADATSTWWSQFLSRVQAANQVVIDPSSERLKMLSNIVCFLIVLTSMTTIFQMAYQYNSAWIYALTYIFELVFILQIYAKFHVTQADEFGKLEMDFDKVYKLYLKNPREFALDLFPTIPFEIIAAFVSGNFSFTLFTYLRLTRLVRLIRLDHFFSNWEKQLDIDMLKVRLIKMLTYVLLIIHTCASVWYFIACPSGVCRESSWADAQGYLSTDPVVSTGERYTDSIYWCVATLTSTGYGDIVAHSYIEMLFASFTMILGQLIVGTVLGNISSTLANRDTQRVQYEKDLQQLKDNMDDNQVENKLKESVVDYFDYLWNRNKGVDQLGQFKNLPYCMRAELALSIYGEHLHKLRLFAECSDAFLRDISQSIHEVILRAGDDMVDEGDIGDEMYIIHVGQVKVMCIEDHEAVECVLKPGDYFDDANLLYDVPRPRTIKAITQVDAVTIAMQDLNEAMERFPEDADKVRENGHNLFDGKTTTKSYVCAAEPFTTC